MAMCPTLHGKGMGRHSYDHPDLEVSQIVIVAITPAQLGSIAKNHTKT